MPHYEVIVTVNGSPVSTNYSPVSEYEVTANEGDEVSITVKAANPVYHGNTGPSSPASDTVRLLSAGGDEDGDGQINGDEDIAGTDPQSSGSVFETGAIMVGAGVDVTVAWNIVTGKTYSIQTASTLLSNTWVTVASNLTTGTWADPSPSEAKKFYRSQVTDKG